MAKKLVLVLLLAAIVAGGLWAQEKAPNTIMFLGSMLSYERALSPNWGIGAEFAVDFFGKPTLYYDGKESDYDGYVAILPLSVDAFARYYPWAGKFFTQLGLGIQMATIGDNFPPTNTLDGFGFHAKVQVGWQLALGSSNWVFEAKLGPAISVGGVSKDGEQLDKTTFLMFSFPIQLGFGLNF